MSGKHYRNLKDVGWLKARYCDEGKTTHEIGAMLGCTASTVARALHRLGIGVRFARGSESQQNVCPVCGTAFDVGGRDNPKRSQVYCSTRCQMFAQKPRPHWTHSPSSLEKRKALRDAEWLRARYVDDRMSTVDIARELECSVPTVARAMRRHGIERRSMSESKVGVKCRAGNDPISEGFADNQRLYNYQLRQALKAEMVAAYGGRCECCGEAELTFLTLDHVRRDGKEDRLKNGGSAGLLRKLQRAGWPKDGYRVLCMNCNMATKYGRTCPHQSKEAAPCPT